MTKIKIAQKWARNYIAPFLSISAIKIFFEKVYGQELDTNELDKLFDFLEERNEAMGSITISKNDKILYSRAIGYRYVSDEEEIMADTGTKYRIVDEGDFSGPIPGAAGSIISIPSEFQTAQ